MSSKCKNCDSVLSYNFVLDIGLCNPCIGKLIGKLEDENKRLRRALKVARCPCGGWLEGIGVNIDKQINVYQCNKCGSRLCIDKKLLQGEPK